MRIERNYYTEKAMLWRMAEEEEKKQKGNLSEEKQAEAALLAKMQAQKIERKMESEKTEQYQVIRQEKLDRFQALTEMALDLAETAPMDIQADTEHFSSRISLEADCLIFVPSSPKRMKTELLTLLMEAESISISRKGSDRIELSMVYSLCSEVPRR